MSTSRSDRAPGEGLGVAALFARAAERAKAEGTPTEKAGIRVTTCGRCGAPREEERLVCRYCKEAL